MALLPVLPRHRRVRQVADGALQRAGVVAFDHRRRQLQPRHVEHADETARLTTARRDPHARVTLERGRLFGLEAARLDGLVGIHAEAADAEAKQHPLDTDAGATMRSAVIG